MPLFIHSEIICSKSGVNKIGQNTFIKRKVYLTTTVKGLMIFINYRDMAKGLGG